MTKIKMILGSESPKKKGYKGANEAVEKGSTVAAPEPSKYPTYGPTTDLKLIRS